MRLLFIAALLLLLGCESSKKHDKNIRIEDYHKNQKPETSPSNAILPHPVLEYLNSAQPGWSTPDTSDYSELWWSFYERTEIPYFVTTDINDDRISDYALILKNQDSLMVVILIGTENTFTHWVDKGFTEPFNASNRKIQFGLSIVPPRRVDSVVDNKESSLVLKSNAMALMTLEFMTRLYYWDNGSVKVFRTKSNYSDYKTS